MDCPQCGSHCSCNRITPGEALSNAAGAVSTVNARLLPPEYTPRRIAVGQSFSPETQDSATQNSAAQNEDWRSEIATRLQAHRAKRRKRNGEDVTMSLGFDEPTRVAVEE